MLPVKRQQSSVISLGVDDILPTADTRAVDSAELKETLASIQKFSRSSSMRSITDDIALRRKVAKFEDKIGVVLQNIKKLNVENDDQLQTLFIFVMQSCSDFIYIKDDVKCSQVRNDLCVKLLKGFVKDDEKLCRSIMSIVQPRIKPSTWLRRNRQNLLKCVVFFARILHTIG